MKNFLTSTLQSQKVFFRYYRRKGFKRFFKENILETDGTPKTKALSVALGILVGLLPLWGFQTIIILFLATTLRLNKILAYMSTHISLPPFIPFIIAASLYAGAPFVPGHPQFSYHGLTLAMARQNIVQYLIGSVILAVTASAVLGGLSYLMFRIMGQRPRQSGHS